MAYSRKRLYEQAMQVIEERNLFFIEDVVAFLPCDRATFYRKFAQGSDECDNIKRALETNKVRTKSAIRHRLFNMDNPTAQLALYRMIATPEERDAISTTKTDITSGGEKITKEPITIEIIDNRNQIEHTEEDDEE